MSIAEETLAWSGWKVLGQANLTLTNLAWRTLEGNAEDYPGGDPQNGQ